MLQIHKIPVSTPLFDTCAFGINTPACDKKATNIVYDSELSTIRAVCEKHLEVILNNFDRSVCCPNCQCHIGIN